MGRYGKLSRQVETRNRPWAVHPIWQGIGCLMLNLATSDFLCRGGPFG